jgi:predicted nucleic-acid-binding protein
VKALDTNVLVRFLVKDDKAQALRVKTLFEGAEKSGERLFLTTPSLLELIWVLSAVYDFTRSELLEAIQLLSQMPILEFEDFELVTRLTRLGDETTADLPDLVIGLAGGARGCESTLTFDKGLEKTGLFERL